MNEDMTPEEAERYIKSLCESIDRFCNALGKACRFIADTRGDCPLDLLHDSAGDFRNFKGCETCDSQTDMCWQLYFLDALEED